MPAGTQDVVGLGACTWMPPRFIADAGDRYGPLGLRTGDLKKALAIWRF